MRHITFFLFLLFLFPAKSVFAQNADSADCKKFYTGTFTIKGMPGVIVTRDDKYQIESEPANGRMIKMSVRWTSDCSYELRLVKANTRHDKKMWKKIGVLVVTITEVDEDSYKFSAVSPALPEAVRGTMIKQ